MSGLGDKVNASIQRLKAFEPPEGYYLAFSGGKDSVVIKALADMARVRYTPIMRLTSVDPPELIRFVRKHHSDVSIDIPRDKNGNQITMWSLIVKEKIPPYPTRRYCCKHLKETGGRGAITVTGVRWAESVRRKKNHGLVTINTKNSTVEDVVGDADIDYRVTRNGNGLVLNYDNDESSRMVAQCYRTNKTLVNPIIDWDDDDVWAFIRAEGILYCQLYDEGFHRIGCVGCPMSNMRLMTRDFARWPVYKTNYIKAFDRMQKARRDAGLDDMCFEGATGEDIYHWWIHDGVIPGQIDMFGELEDI